MSDSGASAITLSDEAPPRPSRSRRAYLVIAAIVAVVAVAAVLIAAGSNPTAISGHVDVANLPDNGPAPPIDATGWINTPPLTAADLQGKVVLYDRPAMDMDYVLELVERF